MVPDAGVLHEHLLQAVNAVVERCWGAADPDTVGHALFETLAADDLLSARAVAHVTEAYLPDTAELVLRYLTSYDAAGERPADDPVTIWLYETLGALANDLAAAYAATARSSYESPSLTGPVHDLPEVFPEEPRTVRRPKRPRPDREPGAAARRRAERAERALHAAHETLEALDWTRIDEENARLLKSLKAGDRRKVLWVRTRGIIVIGRNNSAFDAVDRIRDVQGVGVFAGSLQLIGKPKLLSARRQAVLTDIPLEDAEELSPLLAAHRIDVSLTGTSRWVG
ncbi:hypothetical protein ACFT8P_28305 [Streptomyces sp. NPDC057101]|uniref:hypothetical protein n=1 Tax=Streptomyces sp. NPDC057101 TaxID=3346020 RepID=UPI00363C2BB5